MYTSDDESMSIDLGENSYPFIDSPANWIKLKNSLYVDEFWKDFKSWGELMALIGSTNEIDSNSIYINEYISLKTGKYF